MAKRKIIPEMLRLAPKERKFVEAYVGPSRFRVHDAAKVAGYAPSYGYVLRKKPEVVEAIRALLVARGLGAEEVLDELREVALAPTTHFMQVMSADKFGNPLVVRQDYTAKMKALELLGRAHQLWVEKKEVSLEVKGFVAIARALAADVAAQPLLDAAPASLQEPPSGEEVSYREVANDCEVAE